jgi:hypothetical protein
MLVGLLKEIDTGMEEKNGHQNHQEEIPLIGTYHHMKALMSWVRKKDLASKNSQMEVNTLATMLKIK